MKVAILYIALGKYILFWDAFYESAEKFFLKDAQKEYFVFTDSESFKYSTAKNVRIIKEEFHPWPYATIKRFSFFYNIRKQLSKFDYVFFFNANSVLLEQVDEEILPNNSQGLVVMEHSRMTEMAHRTGFTYERNPESTAYIPFDKGGIRYVAGGFNGGRSGAFLRMCKKLAKNVQIDEEKGITALWHDESHLNEYILDKNPLILPESFSAVEFADGSYNRQNGKILFRSKMRLMPIEKIRAGWQN